MGLTGVVLSLTLRLLRAPTSLMRVDTVRIHKIPVVNGLDRQTYVSCKDTEAGIVEMTPSARSILISQR